MGRLEYRPDEAMAVTQTMQTGDPVGENEAIIDTLTWSVNGQPRAADTLRFTAPGTYEVTVNVTRTTGVTTPTTMSVVVEGGQTYVPHKFFYLKDHLGNTRVLFADDGSGTAVIKQETHYYPYSLQLAGIGSTGGSDNKFLYNGKELEDEHNLYWYHYGARYYDPQLGVWHSIDPADEFYSVYVFLNNNPVRYIDPDGATGEDMVKTARSFLGTAYEYGSKYPTEKGISYAQMENEIVGASWWGYVTKADVVRFSSQLGSAVYNSWHNESAAGYGIDCSGLYCEVFNSNPDAPLQFNPLKANVQFIYNTFQGIMSKHEGSFETRKLRVVMATATGKVKTLVGKGDAVFFKNKKGRISHIGIFEEWVDKKKGTFKMIHAPGTGKNVESVKRNIEDAYAFGVIDQEEK